jgi:TonB-dependent Receptor Plug Domain
VAVTPVSAAVTIRVVSAERSVERHQRAVAQSGGRSLLRLLGLLISIVPTAWADPAPEPAPPGASPVSDVVVQATREPGEGPDVATAQLLDRAQITSLPGMRDDAFRSAARVPGITMNGLSAAPHVRGGGEDEVLALLDGFPIRQPYHLSGYQNVFSLIDPQVLSTMEVFTGGFPARFGGRMSGVFDMRLPERYGASTRGLGMSFYNASARGSDVLSGFDGWDWLAMGRIGTLGLMLDAVAPDVADPSYGDFIGRLRWMSSADREVAGYVVWSQDSLEINNTSDTEHAQLDSRSLYMWLRGEQHWDDGSQLTVWLGNTQLRNTRHGLVSDPLVSFGTLSDERDTSIWDVRARYSTPLSLTQELQIGGEWSVGSADYDYLSDVVFTPVVAQLFDKPTQVSSRFNGSPTVHGLNFFVSHRWDITSTITTETGFRLERESGDGLDAAKTIDPRLAVRCDRTRSCVCSGDASINPTT